MLAVVLISDDIDEERLFDLIAASAIELNIDFQHLIVVVHDD